MVESKEISNSISISIEQITIYSEYLERDVRYDVYFTKDYNEHPIRLLLINDGQDLEKMPFENVLDELVSSNLIENLFCVGIHCGVERKREYGTSYSADFKGRGDKAGLYSKFIFDELLPDIRLKFNTPSFKEKSFAGFSLGGLSALDIVWNHASEFEKVGIFSGSLWWRRKAYTDGYTDESDRLMHLQIKNGNTNPWLKFFIQTGVLDEKADRNNNGIIDSIDDALDLISELKQKGHPEEHIHYLQMDDGKHDVKTWAKALKFFFIWGWSK